MSNKTEVILGQSYLDIFKTCKNDIYNKLKNVNVVKLAFADVNGLGIFEQIIEQPEYLEWLLTREFIIYVIANSPAVKYYTDLKEIGINIKLYIGPENPITEKEYPKIIYKKGKFKTIKETKIVLDDIFKEFLNMKYDIAIMNPPYDKSLHLKILENVIANANEVVNISPVRWLQDPLAKYKKASDYHRYEETISKKIESLDIIDAKTSNDLFHISNFGALGIYKIGKNGGYDYDLPAKEYLGKGYSICNKVLKRHDKLFNHMQKGTAGICVKVAEIRGFGSGKNFDIVSLIHSEPYINGDKYKELKFKKKDVMTKNIEDELFVRVNTVEEGKNFINSTRTIFHHFLIKCWKMDQHVPLKFLPWMRDYTKPWTNARFCKYFGITGYIDDEHAESNSEWETIINEMNK